MHWIPVSSCRDAHGSVLGWSGAGGAVWVGGRDNERSRVNERDGEGKGGYITKKV